MHRYSNRLPWASSPNAFTRLLEQKRSAGAKLLDLTISNPTEVLNDYPHARIARACGAIQNFSYRPDPFGEAASRIALAEYYAARGISISPRRLLLTASTSEAYALLFKLFCDPDDEILAPVPSYPLFDYLASLESVRVAPYRLRYDGSWFIDFATLRQAISSRTRAIIIVNPNNPTGSFPKREEARLLFEIAKQHGLPIICDEVFMEYSFGPHGARVETLIGADSVLTFSLSGLSKSAGMPQMKLAWIAISGPERDCELAVRPLELISDTYLSVATPVQRALPELLRIGAHIRGEITARCTQNLLTLNATLENSAAHVLHVEGGWSAIVRLPQTYTEDVWAARLLNEGDVVVQPGYFFDLEPEPNFVVSLITKCQPFAEAIQRLRQAVDEWSRLRI